MIKKLLLLALHLVLTLAVNAQNAETLYQQAMEKARANKLEEAIPLLDQSISLDKDQYVAWFNRGIMKSILNNPEEALLDFNQTITLAPTYSKGYLNRGMVKRDITDYQGALKDYEMALSLDSNYADAYFHRGLVQEMLGKFDLAVTDYQKALQKGNAKATDKIASVKKPKAGNYFSILQLSTQATDEKYGFDEKNPVKVGVGPNGGPANQRAYLDLLRDANGKPLQYHRIGSCCPYPSEFGLIAKTAMLDKYQISYNDASGQPQKAVLYLSMYDYAPLQIIKGFNTIKPSKP